MESGGGGGGSDMRSTARIPQRGLFALLFTLLVVIIVLLLPSKKPLSQQTSGVLASQSSKDLVEYYTYNSSYPLTPPIKIGNLIKYKIAVVADQDQESKVKDQPYTWSSILKKGVLTYDTANARVTVDWLEEVTLKSHLSEKGRGVELSELLVFNGKLLTIDDRSGVVFEIQGSQLIPWVKLNDGPGNVSKGFKGEWMTVKDHHVYIGGLGKEWTNPSGAFVNDHPQYIKKISPIGHVTHWPWAANYNAMKLQAGFKSPGYLIHESACWSDVHKRWFFLPRRASHESYNDVDDEHRATNILITADESFHSIRSRKITKWNQYRGFSSFKFIPGTQDRIIVALKSEENKGTVASYILAFDLNGKLLLEETKIGDFKFEGVEFL